MSKSKWERDARQRARDNGEIKRSQNTKTRDKLSGKSKRAMKRAEKRGDITKKDADRVTRCVEKGGSNCERRGKKGRKEDRRRTKKCKGKRKRNGDCSYSELFAGLDDSEDIELMEDYFERYDEEELEFIANFLLGSDDEDDEEDDSEDYYYY